MFEARFLIRGIGYLYVKCGTTEEIAAYVGPKGELAVNTDTNWLHVQDGESPGGIPLFMGGGGGGSGATFIPNVSDEGVISWTNDGGLPNPTPKNIKGDKGDKGDGSATNCLCQVTWSNVTLASNSSPLVSGTEKMRLGTVLRMSQYGEYIEVTQACVCMFTVRLRSPSIGGVFDGPATYNVSLRRYKGGGSQQETVVESRSFVINWQKNTLDFSMPAIVYANTGDRFFLRVMQYGAGTAESPPDRTGAQVDMTVWTVI